MPRSHARAAPRTFHPALPRLLRWLTDIRAVRRQRARLTDLDPRMLRDIGVTESEAEREARRALWDVPDRWRR